MTLGELFSVKDDRFLRSTIIHVLESHSGVTVGEDELTYAVHWASTNRTMQTMMDNHLRELAEEQAKDSSLFPWSGERETSGITCDCSYASNPNQQLERRYE
ncbi:hypothetical protein [Candidatus Lucifugimonas marina]|uniref:Uncharacterized protein n=1 Tax=Candidatus Lucifugimonas marina TaxID=3038979 RepID=A0AAJ6CR07_9CHLR|nr:hypothetical protein [SAR202 cluster bacterium JH639]WFG38796.1 hypothetical protein GKO48_03945 [SAR202 cluster bacterium JH1073]